MDGEPASVAAVDGALVGVQLAPGSHTITLRYFRPDSSAGLLVSIASLAVLLGIWRWEQRLSRAARASRLRMS